MRERDETFENLENLQEDSVLSALQRLLRAEARIQKNLCTCPKCLVDMAAIALNSLPPKYVADRYNKFPERDHDAVANQVKVEQAVQMAINMVSRRPHH